MAYEGNDVTITCKDVNHSLPLFQWATRDSKNAVEFLCPALTEEERMSRSSNEQLQNVSLRLVNVSQEDEKDYYCIVGDDREYDYQKFQLSVLPPTPVTSEGKCLGVIEFKG